MAEMDVHSVLGLNMDSGSMEDAILNNATIADSWKGVYLTVKWMQVVTTLFSILASVAFIVYAVVRRVVKSAEVRPFFYLTVSDLLLAICWLIGAVVYRKSVCSRNPACYNIQAVAQMLYISTFFYTLNYIWELGKSLKRKLDNDLHKITSTERNIGRAAIILSSVVPAVLTVPTLYFGNKMECYGNSTHPHSCLVVNAGSLVTLDPQAYTNGTCKIIHLYSTSVFLCVFFLTATSMLVYVCVALRGYYTNDKGWTAINVMKMSLLLYLAIFFFSSVAALLTILKLFDHEEKNELYKVLYYIQAFTAMSQGFLNCLAYWFIQQRLQCLNENSSHDMGTQTPLLSSQKRQYASTQIATNCALRPDMSSF
ncbi:transmembrane protein 116 isoform X2 [Pelobates fuscus]|uniref:transmembrane protein 116 isoform X2 n=1 Tax=Pelobates fuscus TaxID=191477 RepID=UPI002FE4C8FA